MNLVSEIHRLPLEEDRRVRVYETISLNLTGEGVRTLGMPSRYVKRAFRLETLIKMIKDSMQRKPNNLRRAMRLQRKFMRDTCSLADDIDSFLIGKTYRIRSTW